MVNQCKFRSVSNVVNLGQPSILAMCQDDDWNLKSTGSEPISAVLSIMEKKNTKHFLLQQQLAIKAKQSLGNFNKSCSLVILLFSFGKMQLEYNTTRHVIIIYNQLHQRRFGLSHSPFANNKGAHFPIYIKRRLRSYS